MSHSVEYRMWSFTSKLHKVFLQKSYLNIVFFPEVYS